MYISYWRFATFHSDSSHPRKSILHPKVRRSLLKMHDISWNWMLIRQVRLLLPDCLVHLHPDGRTKQGRLQFWAGANGSCRWKGFLVVQGSMFRSHVGLFCVWQICYHNTTTSWMAGLSDTFSTVQLLLKTTTKCCESKEHKLLLVCFVLTYFYDLVTVSNDYKQLWGFFEQKVGENPLLHVSYVELVHPSTT